jgi:hypothetical protein
MAGFNENNYVAATGNPSQPYVAVVNGEVHPFSSQGEAEQAYNALSGQGNGPKSTYSAPSSPGGTVQTREGPRTLEQIRQGIIAAGGTPTGDDAQDVATFNNAGGGSPGGYSAPGGDSGWVNLGVGDLALRAALGQGQLALSQQRFNELEKPQFEWQKNYQGQVLNQQGGQFDRELALRQQIADAQTKYQQGQIDADQYRNRIAELQTRGQLALGGLGLASNEALQRQQLGLQAAGQADQQALARADLIGKYSGGPADYFRQQAVLHGLGSGNGGLADILTGKQSAADFQGSQVAPVARSLDTIGNQMAGHPVDAPRYGRYAAPSPTDIAMRVAQQNTSDPYNSPTIGAAMAMSGPNSEYATPGSVLQQIPGLGQRYLDAATKLSQSNYGVTSDPAQLEAGISQYVRANPEWQRAAQAGDAATKARIEREGFARAAGLPEELTAPIYAQTEAYRQAHGGEVMPMEQVAQLVQAQAGTVGRQRRQQLIQEILGFDPQTAAAFDADWDKNFANNGGQLPAAVDLERDISRRYGYGTGVPPGAGNRGGYAAPSANLPPGVALPTPEPREGFGEMGPGRNLGPMVVGPNGEATHAPGLISAAGVDMGGGDWGRQHPGGLWPGDKGQSGYANPQMAGDPRPPGYNQPPAPQPMPSGGGWQGAGVSATPGTSGLRPQVAMLSNGMGAQRQYQAPVAQGGDPMMGNRQTEQGVGYSAPTQDSASGFLAGLPDPNKIVSREFVRLPKSSQDFAMAGYEAKGYDPNDVRNTILKTLPQQSAAHSSFGSLSAA